MPSNTLGFSGTEIVTFVQNWFGNSDVTFQSMVQQVLPLAEMRFCKAHDWSFLNKINLPLTVVSGTQQYTLDGTTIGFYMAASDVRSIYSKANGVYLAKKQVEDIFRMDPMQNQGVAASSKIQWWAPVADNSIYVWPDNFADTSLLVAGKVTPNALSTLSNYPTIPYRYQEGFIQYVISIMLDRENDDRFAAKKGEVKALIREDIADDIGSIGDTDEPRIHSMFEKRLDGISSNLEALYNQFVWSSVD